MKLKLLYLISCIALLDYPDIAASDEQFSLEQFLNEVRNQNLTLKSEEASTQAAEEGSTGIILPPPMIGLTQMQDQTGTSPGFEVSQSVPFPTKLTSEHASRKSEARAKGVMLSRRQREVLADAKFIYFSLWMAQERINFLQDKKAAIEQHLKLTRATSRSDNFLKIHLIKIESDLDLLENEITQAEQEHREKQIQIAEFINHDPNKLKLIASEFPLSKIPAEESLQTPTQVEVKRLELETLKSREQEAKSTWLPDFNFRFREMGGTQMTPRYSEVMVGASLPFVFFWEPMALSEKAAAERLQGELLLSQEKRQVESRRATLLARAASLKKQLDQFKNKLIPKAESRLHQVHNLAPRDMETLQDHREAMEAFPELKLKALEIRKQYEETISELEKFASGDAK